MIKINDLIWEESLIYVTLLYRINSFRATPLITLVLDYDDKKTLCDDITQNEMLKGISTNYLGEEVSEQVKDSIKNKVFVSINNLLELLNPTHDSW